MEKYSKSHSYKLANQKLNEFITNYLESDSEETIINNPCSSSGIETFDENIIIKAEMDIHKLDGEFNECNDNDDKRCNGDNGSFVTSKSEGFVLNYIECDLDDWAVKNNISENAKDELLQILINYKTKNIPFSANTPLKTSTGKMISADVTQNCEISNNYNILIKNAASLSTILPSKECSTSAINSTDPISIQATNTSLTNIFASLNRLNEKLDNIAEDIIIIKKSTQQTNDIGNININDFLPLTKESDVTDLEQKLTDTNITQYITQYLKNIILSNRNGIQKAINEIIAPVLLTQYNYLGLKNKKRLNELKIFNTCLLNASGLGELEFKRQCSVAIKNIKHLYTVKNFVKKQKAASVTVCKIEQFDF